MQPAKENPIQFWGNVQNVNHLSKYELDNKDRQVYFKYNTDGLGMRADEINNALRELGYFDSATHQQWMDEHRRGGQDRVSWEQF